jgi:hypothetical protein
VQHERLSPREEVEREVTVLLGILIAEQEVGCLNSFQMNAA